MENVIRAFTLESVERLTGVTQRQLKYWDDTEFFKPEYGYENRRIPYSRLYSFQDVVALRVLKKLRSDHDISLQHLRRVGEELRARTGDVWARTKLYVVQNEVVFDDPETGQPRGVVSGQYIAPTIVLERVIGDVAEQARGLLRRDPSTIGKVSRHRYIAHNAPVVEGTRIPTRAIKAFHDEGYSIAAILKQYPTLTEADVRAALDYEGAAAA